MSKPFALDHLEAFRIEGRDARAFAQSQFTVSIEQLAGDRWSPLAWCDSKGRVLSVMMARHSEHDVELVLPAAQAAAIRERLQLFTIGHRVRITETGLVAGYFDPGELTPRLAVDPSRGMLGFTEAPPDAGSAARWRRFDLCCGLPWLAPDSSAQHLPQWLGLEQHGALEFDKGCYPGQEVIARLHYRGSVKYWLAGLKANAGAGLTAHARITDPDNTTVGHFLNGLADGETFIGLAVLSTRISHGDRVLVHVGDRPHPAQVTSPEGLC